MRHAMTTLLVLLLLAGCSSDPLRNVEKLSQVELAENAPSAEALPDAAEGSEDGGFLTASDENAVPVATADVQRRGLLGFFRRKADSAQQAPARDASQGNVTSGPVPDAANSDAAGTVGARVISDSAGTEIASGADGVAPQPEAVQTAALTSQPAPERRSRGGFFSRLRGGGAGGGGSNASGASDGPQGSLDVTLPFGQVATLCNVPDRALGKLVERFPKSGRGYALFDSRPGDNAAHSWFLTGFDDGCARQFTAALAMFGAPEMHEQLRYGPAASLPYSATDTAYEQVKSRVCGARRGQPCGRKIDRLSQNTVFVSVYDRFGGSSTWKDMLLHDGDILAADFN